MCVVHEVCVFVCVCEVYVGLCAAVQGVYSGSGGREGARRGEGGGRGEIVGKPAGAGMRCRLSCETRL